MEAGRLIIKTELDSSEFEDDVENLDKKSKLTNVVDKIKNKFSSIFSKETANKIGSLFSSLGAKLIIIIKKVIGVLGIIGVVIGAIVIAISYIIKNIDSILGTNSQLKADIQYLIWAIKTALEPSTETLANNTSFIGAIIKKIIEYIIIIVKYAMALANLIAGRNLFKNATIENFKKAMEKSNKESKGISKNMAKTTKEMQKQLAGFDEMNVLSKNVDASGGGVGGGATTPKIETPSFEVTNLGEYENKLQGIKDKVVETWDFILNTDHTEAQKLIEQQGGNWTLLKLGVWDWLSSLSNIVKGFYDYWSGIFEFIVGLFTGNQEKIESGVRKIKDGVVRILGGIITYLRSFPEMIWGIIVGLAKSVIGWVKEKIITPVKNQIKDIVKSIKENFKDGFWKGLLNTIIGWINRIIGKLNDRLTITIGPKMGAILRGLGINVDNGKYSIVTIPTIPKLARGGIVNMPSSGVPVGGALAGERGVEGVIPLTDSQQMELLGEAIGRYITINANITNNMNGRVISRELQKIQQESSFASNR